MKIGIIGLPQTGKKTLFTLLSGHVPSEKELGSGKPILSFAEIKDPRFDDLATRYQPKKLSRAKIDIEALPRLEKDAIREGGVFTDIANTDAICHVVRAFANDAVYHVDGSVDAERDADAIYSELILHDLLFIERRMERIMKDIKKLGTKDLDREKDVLLRFKAHLEEEKSLRTLEITPDDEKCIASYPFITRKEFILVLNVSDDDAADTALLERVREKYKEHNIRVIQVSAQVESEIAALETDEERKEFMDSLGIAEPAIALLTRVCLEALNRISFFTCGPTEVRQWTIRRGSLAPHAAGAIHSDLERGFIRAEVIKYPDLVELGSEEKVKQAGKLLVKGKDYTVEDGDILLIRFNV